MGLLLKPMEPDATSVIARIPHLIKRSRTRLGMSSAGKFSPRKEGKRLLSLDSEMTSPLPS